VPRDLCTIAGLSKMARLRFPQLFFLFVDRAVALDGYMPE